MALVILPSVQIKLGDNDMTNTNYTMNELLTMVQEKTREYNSNRLTSASDVFVLLQEYSIPKTKNTSSPLHSMEAQR